MSEVILTVRVKIHLLGLRDYFESLQRAEQVILETLSTNERIKEVKFMRTDSVKVDGPTPKMEVRKEL